MESHTLDKFTFAIQAYKVSKSKQTLLDASIKNFALMRVTKRKGWYNFSEKSAPLMYELIKESILGSKTLNHIEDHRISDCKGFFEIHTLPFHNEKRGYLVVKIPINDFADYGDFNGVDVIESKDGMVRWCYCTDVVPDYETTVSEFIELMDLNNDDVSRILAAYVMQNIESFNQLLDDHFQEEEPQKETLAA